MRSKPPLLDLLPNLPGRTAQKRTVAQVEPEAGGRVADEVEHGEAGLRLPKGPLDLASAPKEGE